MGAPQQVTAHVDAALVLLWDGIVEEQGQIQRRADGRKARLIHRPTVSGRLFRVLVVLAAPCGGNIRKGSFHRKPPFHGVQPYPPALSHSWERGRLWRIYPRHAPGMAQPGPPVKGKPPQDGGAMHP